MPRLVYTEYKPKKRAKALIALANKILSDFECQGYKLTLRQLYYQMVAQDVIKNSQASYKSLGGIISRARDSGMIDWNHIEDRTRRVRSFSHWNDKEDFMSSVVPQYRHDLWVGQSRRVMVFVEKEALEQVVGRAAQKWDVPYFANKGYLSSSAVWNVARNMMLLNEDKCRDWVILHLGDHDPSGIDMTRDIADRINQYSRIAPSDRKEGFEPVQIETRRIALSMEQIEEYSPPPNPAKQTDARFEEYAANYGTSSWELDALRPQVITELIDSHIQKIVDEDKWEKRRKLMIKYRNQLLKQSGL